MLDGLERIPNTCQENDSYVRFVLCSTQINFFPNKSHFTASFNNTTALELRFELTSIIIVRNTEYEYKTKRTKNEPFWTPRVTVIF